MKKQNPDARTVVPGQTVVYHNEPGRPRGIRFLGEGAQSAVQKPAEFRAIKHVETVLHDPMRDSWAKGSAEGGVRLYCTQSPAFGESARWHLQVRAQVKTKTSGVGKHFAIGTASMSRDDLRWLRDQIDLELRRK